MGIMTHHLSVDITEEHMCITLFSLFSFLLTLELLSFRGWNKYDCYCDTCWQQCSPRGRIEQGKIADDCGMLICVEHFISDNNTILIGWLFFNQTHTHTHTVCHVPACGASIVVIVCFVATTGCIVIGAGIATGMFLYFKPKMHDPDDNAMDDDDADSNAEEENNKL